MAQLYAGGAPEHRYERYKIACLGQEEYIERRLEFERQGTPTECLRKGYGMGERHQGTFVDEYDADLLDEAEQRMRREQDAPLRDWDDPVVSVTSRDADQDEESELHDLDNVAFTLRNESVAGRWLVTDEGGNWLSNVLVALEVASLGRARAPASFCGWERPPPAVRGRSAEAAPPTLEKRDYRFMEQTYDQRRVRSVLTTSDEARVFRALAESGSMLFAMPLLHPDLSEEPFSQGFALCEVDFGSRTIVFYAPHDAWLLHYRSIMLQQFIMPRSMAFRVVRMHVDSLVDLVFVLARRLHNRAVSLAQLQRLSNAQKTRYVLGLLQRMQRVGVV